jgi:hypothetical protein
MIIKNNGETAFPVSTYTQYMVPMKDRLNSLMAAMEADVLPWQALVASLKELHYDLHTLILAIQGADPTTLPSLPVRRPPE